MAKRILFFVSGKITEQHKEAADNKNGLIIRSADAYRPGDFIESCDGVCGDVPEAYKKFPSVDAPKIAVAEMEKAQVEGTKPAKRG